MLAVGIMCSVNNMHMIRWVLVFCFEGKTQTHMKNAFTEMVKLGDWMHPQNWNASEWDPETEILFLGNDIDEQLFIMMKSLMISNIHEMTNLWHISVLCA